MNEAQKKTIEAMKKCIVACMNAEHESEYEYIENTCYALDEVDTSQADIDVLVSDPEVQKALRVVVSNIVGTFQIVEEEG